MGTYDLKDPSALLDPEVLLSLCASIHYTQRAAMHIPLWPLGQCLPQKNALRLCKNLVSHWKEDHEKYPVRNSSWMEPKA